LCGMYVCVSFVYVRGVAHLFVNALFSPHPFQIIVANDQDRANTMKKLFKIPDRRFWWIKVKALAESRNWSELDRFAKSKKSPIGYEPFVDECIAMQNRAEAKKYVQKVANEKKVSYFLRLGEFEEAIEAAAAMKSDEMFDEIARAAGTRRDILKLVNDRRAAKS
jgi:hypothetical protein